MSKVGSKSKITNHLYRTGILAVITSDIWERDPEYPKEFLPHVGYDYRAGTGTDLVSCFDGEVINVVTGLGSSYGRQVFVYNATIDKTAHYAHLSAVSVKPGQKVSKDTLIGKSGASGAQENTYAAHLHFGLAKGRITNAGNKGSALDDVWLDVELFDFDNVTNMLALKPFKFAERVNVRSTAGLKANIKDVYKPGEVLNLSRPLGLVKKDGYVWAEYTSSKGTKSAVAVYDINNNEWYGEFK